MFLTGYHGTTLLNAEKIIESNKFNISHKNIEWLGNGIYFYSNISDACDWKNSEAILHSIIKVKDDEYLDIDSENGAKIFNEVFKTISQKQKKKVSTKFIDIQKNQYAVMKTIWSVCDNIKVISASFPTKDRTFLTLIDRQPLRKEFCVKDNDCIKHTYLIKRGDFDD